MSKPAEGESPELTLTEELVESLGGEGDEVDVDQISRAMVRNPEILDAMQREAVASRRPTKTAAPASSALRGEERAEVLKRLRENIAAKKEERLPESAKKALREKREAREEARAGAAGELTPRQEDFFTNLISNILRYFIAEPETAARMLEVRPDDPAASVTPSPPVTPSITPSSSITSSVTLTPSITSSVTLTPSITSSMRPSPSLIPSRSYLPGNGTNSSLPGFNPVTNSVDIRLASIITPAILVATAACAIAVCCVRNRRRAGAVVASEPPKGYPKGPTAVSFGGGSLYKGGSRE